jgi:hypothetical protein
MFAKVFASLWDGTLADPYSRWAVFVFMLAHSDADGNLDMTVEAIARRSCIPLDEVRKAIGHLEAPDPASRSPEEEGRRLVRIDSHREWGWHIVNYPKYRGLRDLDERRKQTREAVARHRKADVSHGKPRKAQAEVEVEVEVEAEKDTHLADSGESSPSVWDAHFSEWWTTYRKGRKQAALKRWRQLRPHSTANYLAIIAGTALYLDSERVRGGFKLDAENFLSKRGWDLEEGAKTADEWAIWEKGGKR